MVSETQAKVHIQEHDAWLWEDAVKDSPSELSSARLCNGLGYSYSRPTEETPRLSEGKKVIECNIENFVSMIAVTQQMEVPSIEFSTAKGNFEREQEDEDTILDLLQPFTEGSEERDASSSTLTAWCDPAHEVVEEQSLDEETSLGCQRCAEEILWHTIPRVRKVSSFPNQEETTKVFTQFPKDPNCEVCKRTKTTRARFRIKPKKRVDGIALSSTFEDLITADQKKLNVESESRCGHKTRSNRARWFHELDSESSDEIETKHRRQWRVYNYFFLRHRSQKEIHRQFKRFYWSVSRSSMGSWRMHPSSRKNERRGRKGRPQSERRDGDRTRAKWTGRRMVGLCDGMLLSVEKIVGRHLTGPSIPFWNTGWVHQFRKFGQRREEYSQGCVLRAGGWSGHLMIADFEYLQESEASEIFAIRFTNPGSIRKNRLRIAVCKRNSKISWSSKTIIYSGRKPRARRWCWNRRRT